MSDLVVVDSVTVIAGILAMLLAYRRGSPRSACWAGIFSGLTFYGYTGGRIMPVVMLLFLPVLALGSRAVKTRRAWVLAGLLAGFVVAAAPSLHYATKRFDEWNGRYNKTSVFFDKGWLPEEVKTQGSVLAVAANQLRLGTIGLLSSPSTIHYVGHPMIAPSILPALGIAGLAWLLGRGLRAEAYLFGLLVAGNLAVTCLSLSTPQPQRGSSLLPALAILGGIACAGFVSLFPERAGRSVRWKPLVATALAGGLLMPYLPGYPLDTQGYEESGGRHAAFSQAASQLLLTPFASRRIYFHGAPFIYMDFANSLSSILIQKYKIYFPPASTFSREYIQNPAILPF